MLFDHLAEVVVAHLEAEIFHHLAELVFWDGPASVSVEEIKRRFEL